MKVLMVASEAAPVAKTGGLADVVYALSKQLVLMGEDISIVLPYYLSIKKQDKLQVAFVSNVEVNLGWRKQGAKIYKTFIDGVTYYLVDNDYYFGREAIYGYDDDTERFAFFSLAVRNMFIAIKYKPDVIHIHDYHGGMIPALIKIQNAKNKFYSKMKFLLTIHNPAFQGDFNPDLLEDFYDIRRKYYEEGELRFNHAVNQLKSAIVYCDKINTVSPTHAEELLTGEGSKGLDSILRLRADDFTGILNGIDYEEFNPETDKYIAHHFSETKLIGKGNQKIDLYQKHNLIGDKKIPLFAMVTRLTWQKGIDLALSSLEEVLSQGANAFVIGSGEYQYEQALENLRARYPQQMGLFIGYNNNLAHEVYAASDFFFMPSLFEPCGIGQMIAQRYGSLPIVRATGGLKDTVIGYNGKNIDIADGFSFNEYDINISKETTNYALKQYHDNKKFKQLVRNAMKKNNDWEEAGKKYLSLYKSLTHK